MMDDNYCPFSVMCPFFRVAKSANLKAIPDIQKNEMIQEMLSKEVSNLPVRSMRSNENLAPQSLESNENLDEIMDKIMQDLSSYINKDLDRSILGGNIIEHDNHVNHSSRSNVNQQTESDDGVPEAGSVDRLFFS